VNIAFGVDGNPDRFTMHSELVGGRAPAWTFLAATGEGSVNVATPVTWATSLPKPTGDAVMSSNDVLVDPRTNDTHLVARTKSGSAAYYFRPKGAAEYRGPIEVFAKSGRVRLVSLSDGTVALVRSDDSAVGGVAVHVVPASAITAGTPIAWSKTPAVRPTLPVEYKQIYAIYTESDSYSLAPRSSLEIAIVGQTHENEVLHISIQGLTR
jgi:hypothetical protein